MLEQKKGIRRRPRNNKISGFGLINSEDDFVVPEKLQPLSCESTLQQDRVVYLNGDLGEAISNVSGSPGLISSRWLVATDVVGRDREINPGDRISFLETSTGDESRVIEYLMDEGAKSVVKTVGIYDLVAISDNSSRGRLEEALRSNADVVNINEVGSTVDSPVEISPSNKKIALHGKNFRGFNKYEGPAHYSNDVSVNNSYFEQCDIAAEQIASRHPDLSKVLIYSPLRGAKPMTKFTLERLREISGQLPQVVYPVTSSFVNYGDEQDFYSKKGKKPASGRHGNILELRRLEQFLDDFSDLIYIDEIVSGGMMVGHCNEMIGSEIEGNFDDRYQGALNEGILRSRLESGLGVHVYGLADQMGSRFRERTREKMQEYENQGLMHLTVLPVKSLITEDQRYLMGLHFLDYSLGPQVVPMMEGLNYFKDKKDFEHDYINYKASRE